MLHTIVKNLYKSSVIDQILHNRRYENITNSVALVRERSIPTERPPLVSEVSANFCGYRGVAWSVRRIPYGRNLGFLDRTSLEHSHKVAYFTRTLARSTSLEHSHKVLH
jgi:hypothetical protein